MRQAVAASLKPLKAPFKAFSIPGAGGGLAKKAHLLTVGLLPIAVLLLVRAGITPLAVILVLLAKWRMLAVRPRFWLTNIRANSVDIIVGLSTVVFIIHSSSLGWQIIWTLLYGVWLMLVKPSSKVYVMGWQALVGEAYGLIALLIAWGSAPAFVVALVAGLICYLAARHFFEAFDEVYSRPLAYLWACFAAATTWLLGHLLFFYGPLSQPALLIIAFSFGGATLYYLDHFDRSSKLARRQVALLIAIAVAVVLIKLVPLMFYVWSDKVI